jgi:hypothetical protein
MVATLAHLGAPGLDQLDERIGQLGIELRTGATLDLADCDLVTFDDDAEGLSGRSGLLSRCSSS